MYLLLCIGVLAAATLLNMVTITIGYHRGLAHRGVKIHPLFRRLLILTGNWVTGLDPKGWAVMHRRHHAYSDTERDPHSPRNVGLLGIPLEQLRSYEEVLRGLARNDPEYTQFAEGLDFELSWVNRRGLWWLPYLVHVAVGIGIAVGFDAALLGGCYFLGMMSHPVQGGMVNSLGHAIGGRNFDTDDHSTNNALAAWLILGEGYQNNHHAYPESAKFSFRRWEFDMGFGFCLAMEAFGILRIDYAQLIPEPSGLQPAWGTALRVPDSVTGEVMAESAST